MALGHPRGAQNVSQALRMLLNPAVATLLIGSGDNPQKFTLHKDYICYYSAILNAAFNGKFE
ncbi:hypothetical protein BGZ57DRAFT_929280 [Hyaloscypha finlandica]|nr:hypothetical protein BGZ57DRAFT_929280 [Hyaloscypha finlandica]